MSGAQSRSRRAGVGTAALLAGWASAQPVAGIAADCPQSLASATQLLLVTAPTTASVRATFRRFERASTDASWAERGSADAAVVGRSGLGKSQEGRPGLGEPRKREGDNRTPEGIFPLGRPFGFAALALPGYMRLVPGRQICVDDPASPLYGQIVPRAEAGHAHGEDMGTVDLYRRGFVVDVPVSAARRSGSCIFVHVWRAPARGTAGCVGLPEAKLRELQAAVRPGALIAILPRPAANRLEACMREPARPGDDRQEKP